MKPVKRTKKHKNTQRNNAQKHWDFIKLLAEKTGHDVGHVARNWRALNGLVMGKLKSTPLTKDLVEKLKGLLDLRKKVKTEPTAAIVQTTETFSPPQWTITHNVTTVKQPNPVVCIEFEVDEARLGPTVAALRNFPGVGQITILENE